VKKSQTALGATAARSTAHEVSGAKWRVSISAVSEPGPYALLRTGPGVVGWLSKRG
jgi:hypothetical protein